MRPATKLALVILALGLVAVLGLLSQPEPSSQAAACCLNPASATGLVGTTVALTYTVQDDLDVPPNNFGASDVRLEAIPDGTGPVGVFFSQGTFPAPLLPDTGTACAASGLGGTVLTYSDACIDGIDDDGNVDSQSATVTWLCQFQGRVIFELRQPGNSAPVSASITCLAPTLIPTTVLLTFTPTAGIETCPGGVLLRAEVRDQNGVLVPNGSRVIFTSNSANLITNFADTVDGIATLTPVFTGRAPEVITVTATSGIAPTATDTVAINARCTTVLPQSATAAATIAITAAGTNLTCGGSTFLAVVAKDQNGAPVPDGTRVLLTTTNGSVSPTTVTTVGGAANAILTAPGTPGVASVTAGSGPAFKSVTIKADCEVPTPAPASGAAAGAAGPSPTAGDGGAAAASAGATAGAAPAAAGAAAPPATTTGAQATPGGTVTTTIGGVPAVVSLPPSITPPRTGEAGLKPD